MTTEGHLYVGYDEDNTYVCIGIKADDGAELYVAVTPQDAFEIADTLISRAVKIQKKGSN